MVKPRKAVVTKERPLHTYAELWHASRCVLDAGIANPEGSAWQFLSSVVLTAFTFEAYLKHIGPQTIECWPELERLPPWSKFELLSEQLGVKFPAGRGKRPLQTVVKLLDFRNTLAHGRSQQIRPDPVVRDANDKLDSYLSEQPLAAWEALVRESTFAKRVREDTEVVIRALHAARTGTTEILFNSGVSLHSATLITKT